MKDILLSQRKYFDGELEKLSEIKNREIRYKRGQELVFHEEFAEFAYRSGFIRGRIAGLGLENCMEEIIDGMNKSGHRVYPTDLTLFKSAKHAQKINRAISDVLWQFALGYIDKWIMYNNLFNEKNKF